MIVDWKTIELHGKPKKYGSYLVTVKVYQEFAVFNTIELCEFCVDTGEFLTRKSENDLIPSKVIAYCEAPKPHSAKD